VRSDPSIVDGRQPYIAARHLGHAHMDCELLEVDADAAYVEGIRLNVAHELPSLLRSESVLRRLFLEPQRGRIDGLQRVVDSQT
jgi:hypothetical protein